MARTKGENLLHGFRHRIPRHSESRLGWNFVKLSAHRRTLLILCPLLFSGVGVALLPQQPSQGSKIQFSRDIRPILSGNCFQCHGPDPSSREEELRLDLREEALADRGGYAVLVPGSLEASELWLRVTSDDPDVFMPPASSHKSRLSKVELEKIRQWILQGAEYEPHWAFIPPTRPPGDSMDEFIQKVLADVGLTLNPPADRANLLRRLFLDLTGLPPTPEEYQDFLADDRPDAYEKWVEKLFSQEPYALRYAERMATPWLDAARYADTNGIHMDAGRQMWKWRDWVLEAYRTNMPFNQFLTDQIAGDLFPDATLAQKIASGFNRNHVITDEGGAIDEEYLVEYAADRINTTGSIFLALNLGCARCHDHKFDPVSQEEYFSLFSYFNSNEEPGLYSQAPDANRAFEPFLEVPDEHQITQLSRVRADLQAVEASKKVPEEKDQIAFQDFLSSTPVQHGIQWTPWIPTSASAENGTTLSILEDQSILSSGDNPENEIVTVNLHTEGRNQRLVLLEVLQDPSLPHGRVGRATNGNAVLSSIEITMRSTRNPDLSKTMPITWAWADHEQKNLDFEVVNLLDPNTDRGWAVDTHNEEGGRMALLLAEEDFGYEGGTDLEVKLQYHSDYQQHAFGRIRLQSSPLTDSGLNALPVADSRWYATWPYKPHEDNPGYDTLFGPETETTFDFTKKFAPDDYTWVFRGDLKDDVVNAQLPAGSIVSFAGKEFFVPSRRKLKFSLGSDDGIQVYVDGIQVFENRVDRGAKANQDQVELDLEAGKHMILFKVINTGGTGGLYVKLVSEKSILKDSLAWSLVPEKIRGRGVAQFNETLLHDWRRQESPSFRKLLAQEEELKGTIQKIKQGIPLTMVMKELPEPKQAYVLIRGEYDAPDKDRPVQRGVPSALGSMPENSPQDRRGLAAWLTSKENPLVARVTVNRIWEQVFGAGLVSTSGDFGLQGAWPSHPELLDWLAVEFQESGWDVQHLLRLIVTSKTYRQSSRLQEAAIAIDPDNALLSSYPRRRLGAEEIRDQALALSGLLIERQGGPSVKPYQPEGLWKEVAMPQSNTRIFEQGDDQELWRRSLYTYWKRASPPPALLTLDAPTREFCVTKRSITNTPLQALVLWNDVQFLEAARVLAQKSMDKPIRNMFERCTGRRPSAHENEKFEVAYQAFLARFQESPTDAMSLLEIGESAQSDMSKDPATLAAWTMMANAFLSLDEVVTKH